MITNPNYSLNRNIVSACCLSGIVTTPKLDYPLGGRVYYQSYRVNICEKCEQECEETDVCGVCGERECEGCWI